MFTVKESWRNKSLSREGSGGRVGVEVESNGGVEVNDILSEVEGGGVSADVPDYSQKGRVPYIIHYNRGPTDHRKGV